MFVNELINICNKLDTVVLLCNPRAREVEPGRSRVNLRSAWDTCLKKNLFKSKHYLRKRFATNVTREKYLIVQRSPGEEPQFTSPLKAGTAEKVRREDMTV